MSLIIFALVKINEKNMKYYKLIRINNLLKYRLIEIIH